MPEKLRRLHIYVFQAKSISIDSLSLLPSCYMECLYIYIQRLTTGLESVSFLLSVPKSRLYSHKTALISHARLANAQNVMKAGLQQIMNWELQIHKLDLEKAGQVHIANSCWVIENARNSRENINFCFIDYAVLWLCESQQIVGNS